MSPILSLLSDVFALILVNIQPEVPNGPEIASHLTTFGLELIINYFKPDNYLYLLNGFILTLPARNKENMVPATLYKFASRIKHCNTEMWILRIV